MLGFLEGEKCVADPLDVFLGKLAVFLPKVLAKGLKPLRSVDELHFALAVLGLLVAQYPDVGGDASVIKHIQREGNDGFEPVVLKNPTADIAFSLACVAGEERGAIVNLSDTAAKLCVLLHLAQHVHKEHQLAVT